MSLVKRLFMPTIGCFDSTGNFGRLAGINYKRQFRIDPNLLSYIWNPISDIAPSLIQMESKKAVHYHSFSKTDNLEYQSIELQDNQNPTCGVGLGRCNVPEGAFSEFDLENLFTSDIQVTGLISTSHSISYPTQETVELAVFGDLNVLNASISGIQSGTVFNDFKFISRIKRGGKNLNGQLALFGANIEFLESLYSSPFDRFIDGYRTPIISRVPNFEEEVDLGIYIEDTKEHPYFLSARQCKPVLPAFAWSIPVFSHSFSTMISSGRAAGTNPEQTLLHGAYELMEDFCEYGQIEKEIISIESLDLDFLDSNLKKKLLEEQNKSPIFLISFKNPLGIPTYEISNGSRSGNGANLDGGIAFTRALLELFHSFPKRTNKITPTTLSYTIPNYSTGDVTKDLEIVDRIMQENSLSLDYVDMTQKDSNIKVYKTFIVSSKNTPYNTSLSKTIHRYQFNLLFDEEEN